MGHISTATKQPGLADKREMSTTTLQDTANDEEMLTSFGADM